MLKIISLLWVKGNKRRKILAELSYEGIELEEKIAEIDAAGDKKSLALSLLEIKKKHGRITDYDYDKEKATLNGEPWIKVKNVTFKDGTPSNGAFEMDWNSAFIEFLSKNGYHGTTDEELVDHWFTSLAVEIAKESGIGIIDAGLYMGEETE